MPIDLRAGVKRLAPMLATSSRPFDDEKCLFEIKWDGVRAMTAVHNGAVRIWGRDMQDYTDRYPELQFLESLPNGTIVDGELVLLRNGRPDFHALMARHRSRPGRFPLEPVRYAIFDILSIEGQPLLKVPFKERRSILRGTLPKHSCLLRREGVIGGGCAFFEKVTAQGHEGVVAKRLDASYTPGKRSSAWRKIKQVVDVACVIVGYRADAKGLRDVLLATLSDGALRYAGAVELGVPQDASFRRALEGRRRETPAISGLPRGRWIEPSLLCVVRYHGRRPSGAWRDPFFRAWME